MVIEVDVKGISIKPIPGKPLVVVERLPDYLIKAKKVKCRLCGKVARYRIRYEYPKDDYVGDPVVFMVCGRHLRAVGVSYLKLR